jgi:hypothetical protein
MFSGIASAFTTSRPPSKIDLVKSGELDQVINIEFNAKIQRSPVSKYDPSKFMYTKPTMLKISRIQKKEYVQVSLLEGCKSNICLLAHHLVDKLKLKDYYYTILERADGTFITGAKYEKYTVTSESEAEYSTPVDKNFTVYGPYPDDEYIIIADDLIDTKFSPVFLGGKRKNRNRSKSRSKSRSRSKSIRRNRSRK